MKLGHFRKGRHSGQDLASVIVEVQLVQHELGGFCAIWQLVNQCEVVWCHVLVGLYRRRVGLRILVLSITTV